MFRYNSCVSNFLYSSQPLVSVLMTVFNAERYLAISIESICSQTFRDWEFIIVDDASTDTSLKIAQAYAVQDERIHVITNDINKGQTHCLNQGLAQARGKWIARQDADDLSLPQRLEKEIATVIQYPHLALVGSCGYMIDEHEVLVGLLDVPLRGEVICWSIPIMNPFLHTSVLFQADVVRFLGGYNTSYRIAQDYDLWCRIISAGYEVHNLLERLVCYRHLPHSLSQRNQEETLQEIESVSSRVVEELYPGTFSPIEKKKLQAWRSSREQKCFWKVYRKLTSLLPRKNILIQKDYDRCTAILHMRIAGSALGLTTIKELLTALVFDSSFVLSWMWERFFPKKMLGNKSAHFLK